MIYGRYIAYERNTSTPFKGKQRRHVTGIAKWIHSRVEWSMQFSFHGLGDNYQLSQLTPHPQFNHMPYIKSPLPHTCVSHPTLASPYLNQVCMGIHEPQCLMSSMMHMWCLCMCTQDYWGVCQTYSLKPNPTLHLTTTTLKHTATQHYTVKATLQSIYVTDWRQGHKMIHWHS